MPTNKREYIIGLIATITDNKVLAESIVERLEEENLLNIHYGDQDVGLIVQAFVDSFGNTKTSKWDRFAAKRLANKHGEQSVVSIIQLLSGLAEAPYAPSVNNVSDLENKFPQIIKFLRSQKSQQTMVDL